MVLDAVIAVRGGHDAKTRLAPRLGVAEREALVAAMMTDMLASLQASMSIRQIWVVTPTSMLATQATDAGAIVIPEPASGDLNAAFNAARRRILAEEPNAGILLLPGDLPLLTVDDVSEVAAKGGPDTLVLAPANTDGGTGAIALAAQSAMPLAFGADSFAKHVQLAAGVGLRVVTVDPPGLCLDVDHPSDLDELLEHGLAGQTGALLDHWRAIA